MEQGISIKFNTDKTDKGCFMCKILFNFGQFCGCYCKMFRDGSFLWTQCICLFKKAKASTCNDLMYIGHIAVLNQRSEILHRLELRLGCFGDR